MCKFRSVTGSLVVTLSATLTACGGGGGSGGSSGDSFDAPSCSSNRVWDAGESDVIEGALSLLSEPDGLIVFDDSQFPCTVFWEFSPSENCSLAFSYEEFLEAFNIDDLLDRVELTGANLTVTFFNDVQDTFLPANISFTQLLSLPDCVFIN